MASISKTSRCRFRPPFILKPPSKQFAKLGIWGGNPTGFIVLDFTLRAYGSKHTFTSFTSFMKVVNATKRKEIGGFWVEQTYQAIECCENDDALRYDNTCAFELPCSDRIYHFFVKL